MTSLHNGKPSWREIGEQDDERERERGGGRWSVKYEEVITLVAAGRTYLEAKVRNDGSKEGLVWAGTPEGRGCHGGCRGGSKVVFHGVGARVGGQ